MEDMRLVIADITAAVGVDITWGGLAQDTGQVQGGIGEVRLAEKVITGVVAKFDVTYTTERFNAYA